MSTADNYAEYDRVVMRPCIYGLAVGDAPGVPYEFCERGAFDCTGMAAGAIAGVYHGFEAIPPKWVGRLRGKAVIDQCI